MKLTQVITNKDYPYPIIKLERRTEPMIPSDWDQAEHRYPNPIAAWRWKHAIACTARLTGEKIIYSGGAMWRRGRLTWIGDCEADTEVPCLIRVESDGSPMSLDRHEVL